MPVLSVVVPARDAAGTLGATLAGLAAQSHPADEVIVVDDGSSDATVAIAEASPVVTRVVRGRGEGPGAARNAGAAVATGDALAFLDADCVPQPGWLAAGLGALENADLVQGRTTPAPGAALGPFDRTLWVTAPWGLFETANMLVTRALFDSLGGFEPWLSPARSKELAEDVWFSWRAVRAGARTAFCDQALVHHAVFERGPLRIRRRAAAAALLPGDGRPDPELRGTFLYRRVFLTPRSAAFDAALAGLLVAAASRRPWPLALALPYARIARRGARERGRWTSSPTRWASPRSWPAASAPARWSCSATACAPHP